MHSQVRDAALAVAGLLAVLAVAVRTGRAGALVDPRGIAVGVVGAIAIEALFLRYPALLLSWWERPGVAVAGLGAVTVGALVALAVAPWLLAAVASGLVVYLVLLGCVLAGVGNPVAVLARR